MPDQVYVLVLMAWMAREASITALPIPYPTIEACGKAGDNWVDGKTGMLRFRCIPAPRLR